MQFSEWEPVYERIIEDMGYDRSSDEASVRLMKLILVNSDLIDDDDMRGYVRGNVVVTGGASFSADDLPEYDTLIATGSSIPYLLRNGIVPDVTVTDLDGDVESQKAASSKGSVTVIHAHGDNPDQLILHAKDFKGKVMMTTQSTPELTVFNFGGFTDGDRAVCMASALGAASITLMGFDFDSPATKDDSDPDTKARKLKWAREIIRGLPTEIVFQ